MYLKRHGGENMNKLKSILKVLFIAFAIILLCAGIFQKYEGNKVSWEVLNDEEGMFSRVQSVWRNV